MHKLLLALGLLALNTPVNYVSVDRIACYETNTENKKIIFDFTSDSLKGHLLEVKIDFYDSTNKLLAHYYSELTIIGKEEKTANINYLYNEGYALINVSYNEADILRNARINLYKEEDCNLDETNNYCNPIYMSEFRENKTIDKHLNLSLKRSDYHRYLTFNKFRLNDLVLVSNYDFKNSDIYLVIKDKIKGYNLPYNEGYIFPLNVVKKDDYFCFELVDDYYANIDDFSYTDEYDKSGNKTRDIYLPYRTGKCDYYCILVISDYINIRINFHLITEGNLYGECENSKYCLRREKG